MNCGKKVAGFLILGLLRRKRLIDLKFSSSILSCKHGHLSKTVYQNLCMALSWKHPILKIDPEQNLPRKEVQQNTYLDCRDSV